MQRRCGLLRLRGPSDTLTAELPACGGEGAASPDPGFFGVFDLPAMKTRFLDTLRERVLFYDGAMGTQLQARSLTKEDFGGKEGCNDYLSLTRPDVVEAVHEANFEAGADAVETNSFQASRLRLEEWGIGDRTPEINRAAAAIARRLADRFEARD